MTKRSSYTAAFKLEVVAAFVHTLLSDMELSSLAVTLATIILRYAVLQRSKVYDSSATYIPATK